MENLGPINICRNLIREMKQLEICKEGKLRFHTFPYDWRRELQHSSEALQEFLEGIHAKNGGEPITVIARMFSPFIRECFYSGWTDQPLITICRLDGWIGHIKSG
jgi:hypothetical protein